MHARALNMLHDTGDQHILAVGNDIHLELNARKVLIDQHRVLYAAGQDALHIGDRILFPA